MTDAPRVLFVSKPIVPPWHDGSKNLVRDVASSLTTFRATVMTTPEGATERAALPNTAPWPLYESSGRFAPGLEANARVLAGLVRARGYDVWHFVFAPNTASSSAARLAMTAGRLRQRIRVVQTIASRPKSFTGANRLLFGDVVVALSEWTRARLMAAGADTRRIVVIPPCARPIRVVSAEERAQLRERFDLGAGPIVLYAGDLEVSTGAETVARAARRLVAKVPETRIVFACRKKTPAAAAAEAELRGSLDGIAAHVRIVGELDDLAPLLAETAVMALPADDLYGKVDVPLVVIEALAAGVPLVLARGGPLESVQSARFVEPYDDTALAREILGLLPGAAGRAAAVEAGRALYAGTFAPTRVAARYEEIYAG